MKPLFFFLLLCLYLSTNAQLSENFSDGDFTGNPAWSGHTDRFTVSNGALQLLDASPVSNNTSFLYLNAPTSLEQPTVWEFLVRLAFAPSATNFASVYLSASSPDLSGPLDGYLLKIGGISGDGDALELYRQEGQTQTLLIRGSAGAVGGDPALARVRITRQPNGRWDLEADYSGGENFDPQGNATDATFSLGTYFGIVCRYTSTRSQAFFFDDIFINPLYEDQLPPQVLEVQATGPAELSLRLSEPVNIGTAGQLAAFSVDQGIGAPASIGQMPEDMARISLGFDTPFSNLTEYTLTVTNLTDLQGNINPVQSLPFTFFNIQPAEAGDLIISEIMADPSPPLGLPNAEYVEIHNRSDKVIQLEGLQLADSGSPRVLPSHLLLPGAYLIICDDADAAGFSALGPTMALGSFPQLTNGGESLTLSDAGGTPLFTVFFSDQWYGDAVKAGGGWSLELIRLEGPYDCSGNWAASIDNRGGTPGQANSVLGTAPENQAPRLTGAFVESPFEIVLVFDEEMDPAPAADAANFAIDGGIDIENAFLQEGRRQVLLSLSAPLQEGAVYTVTAGAALTDCLGNPIGDGNSARVGLAEPIEAGDLVINELLFEPEVGGKDFIELYNRSGKVLNLRGLRLGNRAQGSSAQLETVETDYLLFPGAYAVLTSDPEDIRSRYTVPRPDALIEAGLPTLSPPVGNLTLISPAFITIDSFDYDEKLHSPLLDDTRGVSLERLNPDTPADAQGNWHSAAAAAGFATPTGRNSQFFATAGQGSNIIDLPAKRFSPDGDGFEDVLLIQYQTDQPGYLMNIQIFDAQGRPVRRLVRNALLAENGAYLWDGTNDEGRKARIGIYVLWIELHHPGGNVEQWKETCVLAGRF